MSEAVETRRPVIGIVGSQGAYGRWLGQFFSQRLGLQVLGRDPAGDEALSEAALIAAADVLIFSAPIRVTPELIRHYVRLAAGTERGKLWMDLTSIKSAPVEALLESQAEVVGLHPMCAPPKTPTLRGRPMVVCAARLDTWRDWLDQFLQASEAHCSVVDPVQHDRIMALVQGLTHASHMLQAAVLAELAPALGGMDAVSALGTIGYELDLTVTRRILHGNPDIYADIQFDNPHVLDVLDRLRLHLDELGAQVAKGDAPAREQVRQRWLIDSAAAFGRDRLAEGSYAFERLGYLLEDLSEPCYLSVFLPQDRPGSLRALLSAFEQCGVNLDSIHSSRNPDGELHFRLGISRECPTAQLEVVRQAIESAGIGRVVDHRWPQPRD
ncbi:prephenate dehydrogenase [Frateuria aurantia]